MINLTANKIGPLDKGEATLIMSNMPWVFYNPEFLRTAIPLSVISEYCQRPNYMFGTLIYDNALRLQCDLLQFLLVFHLKRDFRYHQKVSAWNTLIQDPISRQTIREHNLNDPELKEKYFNKNFDLKKFVLMLYESFFPNVTWRYFGGK